MSEINSLFSPITTFIFDYDGVMTDGTVFSDHDGHPWRATNVKDGYALQLASKLGYHVAVISGAICPSMITRMTYIFKALEILKAHGYDGTVSFETELPKSQEHLRHIFARTRESIGG